MASFQNLLEEARELKALPYSAVRLSSLLSHADWVLKDIVQVVEHDLVLTGRLLRLANSSTMAASHPVSSVGDAIVRVGPGPILNLALASAVRMELQRPLTSYGLGELELWRHSVATALAVDRARKFCGAAPPRRLLRRWPAARHRQAHPRSPHGRAEASGERRSDRRRPGG